MVAAGRSNKEIAGELIIARGTVKKHTANFFSKLDVENRTEAVAKARQMDLLLFISPIIREKPWISKAFFYIFLAGEYAHGRVFTCSF